MIKADIDYFHGKTVIEVQGTSMEILADTMRLIQSIHRSLPEGCGDIYKKLLRKAANQEGGPLWKTDEDKDKTASEAKAAVDALIKKIAKEGR